MGAGEQQEEQGTQALEQHDVAELRCGTRGAGGRGARARRLCRPAKKPLSLPGAHRAICIDYVYLRISTKYGCIFFKVSCCQY